MDTARFEGLLGELKLPFEKEQVEEDLLRYAVKIDEAEGLEALALLYSTEDGEYVRLLGYVDEPYFSRVFKAHYGLWPFFEAVKGRQPSDLILHTNFARASRSR